MFDVFYTGPKPNLFAFEKPAIDLAHAKSLSRTKYFWYLNGLNDYSDFDFDFVPVPWEGNFTHVWPSQWQQNGGTYLVPTAMEELKWHWVDSPIVKRKASVQIFYLDFMNEGSKQQFDSLQAKWPNLEFKSTRYVDNHITTFNRIANLSKDEFIWIISSICDYSDFDFTWHHAQWQEHMIHCFASDNQIRGDTFYLNPKAWQNQTQDLELLDWYQVINYISTVKIPRKKAPIVHYSPNNLTEVVRNYSFNFPYAVFTNSQQVPLIDPAPCVWNKKDRVLETFNSSNSIILAPRDVKVHLKKQIYDYPYVVGLDKTKNLYNEPLDIIYISNGEPDEEKWFTHTQTLTHRPVTWIRGINGRSQAYKAAAKASTTPWFLAVFAKLEIASNFNFDWQPDYFLEPKHYIFHAKNPVNDLEYGHMAVIAYNRDLVLNTDDYGLDFTMASNHAVIPILSGTAHFNVDAWTTWRTAFREVLKLQYFNNKKPNYETAYRLKVWLNYAQGKNAEWCLQGANDAVNYFYKTNGDVDKLLLSVEWQWLKNYAAELGRCF